MNQAPSHVYGRTLNRWGAHVKIGDRGRLVFDPTRSPRGALSSVLWPATPIPAVWGGRGTVPRPRAGAVEGDRCRGWSRGVRESRSKTGTLEHFSFEYTKRYDVSALKYS